MEIVKIDQNTGKNQTFTDDKIVAFLAKHLDQYGDSEEAIQKCVDYVFAPDKGGFVILGVLDNEIVAASIVNRTGMSDYIPENILVYIAVNSRYRGKGYGKQLMQQLIEWCDGDIALHVEKENPARFLYEKLGFKNPYLEMRLKRK